MRRVHWCALLWALMVSFFSSPSFGSANTGQALASVVETLGLPISPSAFALLHLLLRKGAHLAEYALLGALVYLTQEVKVKRNPPWRTVSLTLFMVLLYSLADEVHQAFVLGRNGSVFDSSLDVMGAALGILIVSRENLVSGVLRKLTVPVATAQES